MTWSRVPESFKLPIFPMKDWDPSKPSNPVVKITFEKCSETFDSQNARYIQALMSPLAIDTLEACFDTWRRLEEKSLHRLFVLIDFWILEQIKTVDEVEKKSSTWFAKKGK